jgi:hypothetical protein
MEAIDKELQAQDRDQYLIHDVGTARHGATASSTTRSLIAVRWCERYSLVSRQWSTGCSRNASTQKRRPLRHYRFQIRHCSRKVTDDEGLAVMKCFRWTTVAIMSCHSAFLTRLLQLLSERHELPDSLRQVLEYKATGHSTGVPAAPTTRTRIATTIHDRMVLLPSCWGVGRNEHSPLPA